MKTIVNSKDQGLAGQTLGEPSINDAGTVGCSGVQKRLAIVRHPHRKRRTANYCA